MRGGRERGLWRWVQAKAGQSTMPGSQWDTVSFWEPARPPPGGPSGVQGYMVSARQVHLPRYLCPTHASTLLSPAPSAPYGNDLLLPDPADTHGSPSACSATAAALQNRGRLKRPPFSSMLLNYLKFWSRAQYFISSFRKKKIETKSCCMLHGSQGS